MSPLPLGIVSSGRVEPPATSPISVVQVKRTTFGATGPQTVTFTEPVVAGDKVAVLYTCHRATSVRVIASIAGMGGTWVSKYLPGSNASMWLGNGVNATGAVTITQNSPAAMTASLYLIRGLTSDVVSATFANMNDGNPKSVSLSAGKGQIALSWASGFDADLPAIDYPQSSAPAGWTFETNSVAPTMFFGSGYRTPGSTADQTITAQTMGVGDTVNLNLAVLGSIIP